MIIGPALYSVLSNASAVTALVGTRIYPEVLPEDCPLPALAYDVIVDVPTNSLAGHTSGLTNARVQIDVYAKAYVSAQTVADAVANTLKAYVGTSLTSSLLSKQDGYEDDPGVHRVVMDFSIWTKES